MLSDPRLCIIPTADLINAGLVGSMFGAFIMAAICIAVLARSEGQRDRRRP